MKSVSATRNCGAYFCLTLSMYSPLSASHSGNRHSSHISAVSFSPEPTQKVQVVSGFCMDSQGHAIWGEGHAIWVYSSLVLKHRCLTALVGSNLLLAVMKQSQLAFTPPRPAISVPITVRWILRDTHFWKMYCSSVLNNTLWWNSTYHLHTH